MTTSRRRRVLLIGGSLHQTAIMHEVGNHLAHHEYWHTPTTATGP